MPVKLVWKSYPPDARWARYRGSAAFRGTRNQGNKNSKQLSQSKTQYYSICILSCSLLNFLSSADVFRPRKY